MPAMTSDQQNGIVTECFHHRQYFLRQLFQSLPKVLMVFSQSTTDAFLAEMSGRFSAGDPKVGDTINDLLSRVVRLRYGVDNQGNPLEARVIFSPHITGTPAQFAQARSKVLAQLVSEAKSGGLQFNSATGHLQRPQGACVFCTMMQIGPCDYESELQPLSNAPSLTSESSSSALMLEKQKQLSLLSSFLKKRGRKAMKKKPPLYGEIQSVRVAPSDVAMAAEAGARRALSGWQLSGNPARQRDREPTKASPSKKITTSVRAKSRARKTKSTKKH
jgi:hypothetical protein